MLFIENFKWITPYTSVILILSLIVHPSLIKATSHYPYSIEDEDITYKEYGVFASMLQEFEEVVDHVDDDMIPKGLFKKWGQNLKNWFKKRTRKMCKKFLKLAQCSNPEECAYTAARTKRKIDKVYDTGSLDHTFGSFDKKIRKAKNPEAVAYFKNRVEFFYHNKHLKPKSLEFGLECQRPDSANVPQDLKNMTDKQIWGCVLVFCGVLIGVIPFPGCAKVGDGLFWLGIGMVGEETFFGKGLSYEEEN